MSKGLRHKNYSPIASLAAASASGRKLKNSISGGSQLGDFTPASAASFEDDELHSIKKRYQDIEERRLREWENYQRSHRSSLEHSSAKAFLDIAIGDVPAGRLVVELFEDVVPLTVENFRCLITGSSPYDPLEAAVPKLDYVDSCVYRIDTTKHRCICLGELHGSNIAARPSSSKPGGNGDSGSIATAGTTLDDENFAVRHNQRGMLSMVSRGPNTVGSAFSITLDAAPSLDYKQVVFGKVIDGLALLDKIETLPLNRVGVPLVPISITFCGALTGPKPPGIFEPVVRVLKEDTTQQRMETQDSIDITSDAAVSPKAVTETTTHPTTLSDQPHNETNPAEEQQQQQDVGETTAAPPAPTADDGVTSEETSGEGTSERAVVEAACDEPPGSLTAVSDPSPPATVEDGQ